MTILGNAAKWALLMPFIVLATGAGVAMCFFIGWGFASLVTDSMVVKIAAGLLAEVMGLGAVMGAAQAQ